MATRVILGWDTEFQEVDPEGLGRPNPLVHKGRPRKAKHKTAKQRRHEKYNDVLAYSICILNPVTGRHTSDCVMRDDGGWMDWRHRLNTATLIGAAIAKGVGEGIVPADDTYEIVFCAHFAAADAPALRDFEEITQGKGAFVTSLRKTYATRQNPGVRHIRIPGLGHNIKISIRFCDTILWTPATHRSIAAVGAAIGLEKITLPPGAISNMKKLLADDPVLFREYAIRDAEVAALYAHQFLTFCEDVLQIGDRPPVTASGAGVKFALNQIKADGVAREMIFGTDKDGEPLPGSEMMLAMGAECFHGARNECFWMGPTPEGVRLYDWDLPSCYLTTLSMIGLPDWGATYTTTDLDALAVIDDALTFAFVRFEFPHDVRFPSLPVRGQDADGLFFPRTGESWCTGPELVVALNLGAKIEVIEGRVLPHDPDAYRPFFRVLNTLQDIRTAEKNAGRKGSLNERLAKEIANSLYGQVARAVSGMRAGGKPVQTFNLQSGDREELTPSKVTSAPIAAFVTGVARACLSELINDLPSDALVISCTTDGFLTSADKVDNFGPVTRAFMDTREMLVPGDGNLELKHTASRALSIRTRGAFAIDGDRTKDPLMARAGNKMDEGDLSDLFESGLEGADRKWAENDYWTDKAVNREYGDKVRRGRLRSIVEQWELRGGDLTRKDLDISIALEYDFKRRLLEPETEWRGLAGIPTAPWNTAAEAFDTREKFANWRRYQSRVLKSAKDLADFRAYQRAPWRNHDDAKLRHTAIRAAVAKGTHGLPPMLNVSLRKAAQILTDLGFPTGKDVLLRLRDSRDEMPAPAQRDIALFFIDSPINNWRLDECLNPNAETRNPDLPFSNSDITGVRIVSLENPRGRGMRDRQTDIRPIDIRKAAENLGITRRDLNAAMKKAIGAPVGPPETMKTILGDLAFGDDVDDELMNVVNEMIRDAVTARLATKGNPNG